MERETKDFMLGLSGILQLITAGALVYFSSQYHKSTETIREYEEATPVIREINNDGLEDIVLVRRSGKTFREYLNLGNNKYTLLKNQQEKK